MKSILFFLGCVLSMYCRAQLQNDTILKTKLDSAWAYLNGIKTKQDTSLAMGLFTRCAQAGNPVAMNALGVQYKKGLGVQANRQIAIQWFTKAANAGYTKAWYNLGILYRETMDFTNAYQSFGKAALLGDVQSVYAQGYMLYKGFGCKQDYTKAAILFAQGANVGKPNSMYYYGLCLRNGYGVNINIDSARYWLLKAASLGYKEASGELLSKEPENIGMAGSLADKIKGARAAMPKTYMADQYQKVGNRVDAGEVSGTYKGYLLKYDWSGQHPIEANKLTVSLGYDKDSLTGVWSEDDSLAIPVHAYLSSDAVVFGQMQYSKTNHNSPIRPELAIFKKASLRLDKIGDSVYLSGNIEQYIPNRNEPSKPLYLALVRTKTDKTTDIANGSSKAYPNPFGGSINLDFVLKEACQVTTKLLSIDGKVVYNNPAGTLQVGSYSLTIQTAQLTHGYYTLVLQCGSKTRTTQMVKL